MISLRDDVLKYIRKTYKGEIEYPWMRYPDYGVVRHKEPFGGVGGAGAHDQRITNDTEIGRHTSRICVEDGVALDAHRHITTFLFYPDTLEHGLGSLVFFRSIRLSLAVTE